MSTAFPVLSKLSTGALEESANALRKQYEVEEINIGIMQERNYVLGQRCEELARVIAEKRRGR